MTTEERLSRWDALALLLSALRGQDFGGHPACADEDPELFFPFPGQTEQIAEAKAVCARCPVRTSCLTFALPKDVQGIWGGTTDEERRAARRRAA